MKKLLLVPALLLSSALMAKGYKYEITPIIGYNIAEGNLKLDNAVLSGVALQYNSDTFLKPEFSLLHSSPNYENTTTDTGMYRLAINGVHEYDSIGIFTPLAKIGVGYETLNRHLADNKDSVFFDAGAGVKVAIVENVSLKLEAVYMVKNNDNRWDNNLALLAGINFAFGQKAQKEAPIQEEPKVEAVVVAKTESKPVDGDDDKDGVLNSVDKCPDTPAGHVVDSQGCTKRVNLHVNFETASYTVDEASKPNVKKFAEFLKARKEYDTKIIGHTDSVGTVANNQILSDNRANTVKDLIVKEGVEEQRVFTKGMSELAPTATNKTKEGRAQNRRVEAELIIK